MPVTIKAAHLKYKNEQGEYVGVNSVSDQTTAEQIAAIESAGEEVINSIPSDYSALSQAISGMNTATATDVGKALKAKTVSGGKVTEWEFGEVGGSTVVVDNTLTHSGEAADSKTVGDALNVKIEKPSIDGGAGSVLTSDGNGGTSWSELGNIENVGITVSGNKLIISSSGGGGGGSSDSGTWTLVKDITLSEEEIVNITTDNNGDALQLTSARVLIVVPADATYSGSRNFTCWYNSYNIGAAYAAAKTGASLTRLVFDVKQDHGFWDTECRGTMVSDSFTNIRASINTTNYFMFRDIATYKHITKITSDLAMPAGTQIKIWTIL